MNKITGQTTIEIGGKKRPLKFGTNQSLIYCELRKIEFNDYLLQISSLSKSTDLLVMRDIMYSGLVAGARTAKQEVDFDEYEVGDWMDEISPEELAKAFEVMAESKGPNVKAPKVKQGQS